MKLPALQIPAGAGRGKAAALAMKLRPHRVAAFRTALRFLKTEY